MAHYSRGTRQPALGLSSHLAGTGQVADDLYLIGHHERDGNPYLSPRALGVGLAGGLLAELMDAGIPAVTFNRGCLVPVRAANGVPVARSLRIDDPVRKRVLDQVIAEPEPLLARDWLLFFAQTAAADVAGRLERAGYLSRRARRIPRRSRRLVPGDRDWAHMALVRAYTALNTTGTPDPYTAILAGLAFASGLGFRFAGLADTPARSPGQAIRMLSPPMQELIAHTQATADSALLAQRR